MSHLSFTQVSLFQLCPRRYSYRYREHLKDTVGAEAVYSREVLHPALASLYLPGVAPDFPELWRHYTDEVGEMAITKPLLSLSLAQSAYTRCAPLAAADLETYDVDGIEQERHFWLAPGGVSFIAKPDVVLRHKETGDLLSVDFKFSTRDPFLPSFHSQFVSQAIACEASAACVITIGIAGSRARNAAENVRAEVSRTLLLISQDQKSEWFAEAALTARIMAQCDAEQVWPKVAPGACMAFGRPCEWLDLCEQGALRVTTIARMQQDVRAKKEAA